MTNKNPILSPRLDTLKSQVRSMKAFHAQLSAQLASMAPSERTGRKNQLDLVNTQMNEICAFLNSIEDIAEAMGRKDLPPLKADSTENVAMISEWIMARLRLLSWSRSLRATLAESFGKQKITAFTRPFLFIRCSIQQFYIWTTVQWSIKGFKDAWQDSENQAKEILSIILKREPLLEGSTFPNSTARDPAHKALAKRVMFLKETIQKIAKPDPHDTREQQTSPSNLSHRALEWDRVNYLPYRKTRATVSTLRRRLSIPINEPKNHRI